MKKILSLVICGVLFLTLITGCGSSSEEDAAEPAPFVENSDYTDPDLIWHISDGWTYSNNLIVDARSNFPMNFGGMEIEIIDWWSDPNADDVHFRIDHFDMQEIVNASKKLTDEQVQELLSTKIYNIHKAPELINIYKNYIYKFITLVNGQLIPKWSAIDKFGWVGEENDPVDENGKIKIPALQRAIDDAGKVASAISNNQAMLKSDAYQKDKIGRSTGTMEELGFNKQNIVELVKICSDMMDEQIQNKWNYWYITSEGHRGGWNFAVNHVIRDYYEEPDLYPGLQAGEQVFLTATVVIECLQRELSRFLVKFMKVTGTSAI